MRANIKNRPKHIYKKMGELYIEKPANIVDNANPTKAKNKTPLFLYFDADTAIFNSKK